MSLTQLTIATRGSKLALWQAEFVRSRIEEQHPDVRVDLEIIKTTGDKILDVPLAKVGGKGLFVKEIEDALLDGRADIAVHSMKDVPMELPKGLCLGIIPERADPADAFLSTRYPDLDSLPRRARVGTSSLRRQAQLLARRPDLDVQSLRGNVDTRLRKLQSGDFDAILLASAALERLGLTAPHQQQLGPPEFLPAVGQGALGLEFREDRNDLRDLLAFMEHAPTRVCVTAERAFLRTLDGGCQVPIAGHAILLNPDTLQLFGMVAAPDGTQVLRSKIYGPALEAESLGRSLAETLLGRGGREILKAVYAAQKE